RRRHTRWPRDWSSDVCSSDLLRLQAWQPLTAIGDRSSVTLVFPRCAANNRGPPDTTSLLGARRKNATATSDAFGECHLWADLHLLLRATPLRGIKMVPGGATSNCLE